MQFGTHAIHRHLDSIQIAAVFIKISMPMLTICFPLAQIIIERAASSNRNAVHFPIHRKRTRQTTPHALSRQCTARVPVQNVHTATAEHKIDTEYCPLLEFHRHFLPDVKGKVNGPRFSSFSTISPLPLSNSRTVSTASADLLIVHRILAPERTLLMVMQFNFTHAPP